MNPIELLRAEHRAIQRVLDLVDRAREEAQSRPGAPVHAVLFQRAADFFITWVDGTHQAKEALLYRAMVHGGLPLGGALLDRIEGEHAMGHEMAAEWRAIATRAVAQGGKDADALLAAARSCVRLLREHSEEEERLVFPVAQRLLAPAVLDSLRSQFARIEATHGSLVDAAQALERTFTPAAREAARTRSLR
jgi:hemerythrin-like domain-containing protein